MWAPFLSFPIIWLVKHENCHWIQWKVYLPSDFFLSFSTKYNKAGSHRKCNSSQTWEQKKKTRTPFFAVTDMIQWTDINSFRIQIHSSHRHATSFHPAKSIIPVLLKLSGYILMLKCVRQQQQQKITFTAWHTHEVRVSVGKRKSRPRVPSARKLLEYINCASSVLFVFDRYVISGDKICIPLHTIT